MYTETYLLISFFSPAAKGAFQSHTKYLCYLYLWCEPINYVCDSTLVISSYSQTADTLYVIRL